MNWFERLMFRRIPLWVFALFAIFMIAGLSAYGWLVKYKVAKGPRFETIGRLALDLASVPDTLNGLRRGQELGLAPVTAPKIPDGLHRKELSGKDPELVLVARYDSAAHRFIVALTDMRNGTVLRRYAPDIKAINARSKMSSPLIDLARDRFPERYRLSHPLLMDDGGIVFQDAAPLVRVNACGKILWTLDGLYHHSIERDADGNLWVPDTVLKSTRKNVTPDYREDGIAKISPDGKLLFRQSLADILERNGLGYLFEGQPYSTDAFHLNDIEPVLRTGPYMTKGDLFLSLRHLSLLVQYRPSTGKIIWWQQGPWRMQHDINILDDRRVSLFDNRVIAGNPETVDQANDLLIYDLATKNFTTPYSSAFKANNIKTVTQGRGTPLGNGDVFVEETEYGRLLRMNPQGKLRWEYVSANPSGKRLFLAWSRILDNEKDAAAIAAAKAATCK